jgi:hypothetical protein
MMETAGQAPTARAGLSIPAKLRDMLLIALVLALLMWALAAALRADNRMLIWDDLRSTFADPLEYLDNPYDEAGYFAAPWGNIFLIPFDPLPLEASALSMIVIYFLLIAGVIYKFGGDRTALLIALTSVLAVDTALEINIDWLVCIGLLVPPMWSAPFLMIKPQTAFGYVLSFSRREFVRATIVALVVLLASFLIWGFWITDVITSIQIWDTNVMVNLAPMVILPRIVSIGGGIVLSIYAFRKRDPVLCTAAGLFFVPYIAPNSILIPFALLTARYKRFTLLISVVLWIIVLSLALPFFRGG